MPQHPLYDTVNGAPRLINRVLEVNSCHLPLADVPRLDIWPHLIARYEGGWLIHLDVHDEGAILLRHESLEAAKELGFSPVFVDLLRLAVMAQCFLLRIHQDGEIYSDYPTFKW